MWDREVWGFLKDLGTVLNGLLSVLLSGWGRLRGELLGFRETVFSVDCDHVMRETFVAEGALNTFLCGSGRCGLMLV